MPGVSSFLLQTPSKLRSVSVSLYLCLPKEQSRHFRLIASDWKILAPIGGFAITSGFKSQPCHSLAVCPWGKCPTFSEFYLPYLWIRSDHTYPAGLLREWNEMCALAQWFLRSSCGGYNAVRIINFTKQNLSWCVAKINRWTIATC